MKPLEPAIITIFGITGDLAKRKLLPALYHLAEDGLLPDAFRIVGLSRRNTTTADVIESMRKSVAANGETAQESVLLKIQGMTSIIGMNITEETDYKKLKTELDGIEYSLGVCLNRLFYLAIPATLFGTVSTWLKDNGLDSGCQHGVTESRLLIEKPFGFDLVSARELINEMAAKFTESQIYRIDHYLAKETVQNIMTFRFENPLFKSSWDSKNIDHVMITAAESLSIEGRANLYEPMGALRDLIQSHLLQLLSLIAMEHPGNMSSASIHKAKATVLSQVRPPHDDRMTDKAVRGQYNGYRSEVENNDSMTETYAAIEFSIDNDRWRGVPFFVRTGKALKSKLSQITVVFRDPEDIDKKNYLTFRIQPNEGIVLDLTIKKPGFEDETEHVQMDFCYNDKVNAAHPDAYERVIVDSMRGDKTLFATNDEVIACWEAVQPVLHAWENDLSPLIPYEKGTWGPDEANKMIEEMSGKWLGDEVASCEVHKTRKLSK